MSHDVTFYFSLGPHVTFCKTLPSRTFYSFYERPRRISTTFKVAMSHFVSYPREPPLCNASPWHFWNGRHTVCQLGQIEPVYQAGRGETRTCTHMASRRRPFPATGIGYLKSTQLLSKLATSVSYNVMVMYTANSLSQSKVVNIQSVLGRALY